MRNIAIVPHIKKELVADTVKQLVEWLEGRQIGPRLPEAEAQSLGFQRYGYPTDTLFEDCDLVIAVGGDGTALRAARLMGRRTLPLLGVNLGEIGFLMLFRVDDMIPALERVTSGDMKVEERAMALATVKFTDGTTIERLAVNDILIGREEFSRLTKLDFYVNDQFFNRYAADGIVIATPTGSTAYSFSARGPFVSPRTELLLMTPISPHSLLDRSMVFAAADVLTVRRAPRHEAHVRVSIDGTVVGQAVDEVTVRVAPERFKFVLTDGPDFFTALRDKLKFWAGGG